MLKKPVLDDKCLWAYIIGLAVGDGNLSNPNGRCVRLRISCDLKYPYLIDKIRKSLHLLLPKNKTCLAKKKGNCVDIISNSNYWPELLGWKSLGSKFRQSVDVPLWVKEDWEFSINCLRGMIETDGSIYIDRGYPMVMFVNIIPQLIKSFEEMVSSLGFLSHTYKITPKSEWNSQKVYHIRISKRVKEFLELIKPEKK